jgi:hypothetical protein
MRALSLLLLSVISVFSGCASRPGQVAPGTVSIQPGQWTTPQEIGQGRYVVQGWDTEDAINGAKSFCLAKKLGLESLNVQTHTARERATVIFVCR